MQPTFQQTAQRAASGWMGARNIRMQALAAARFAQHELRAMRPGMTTVRMHAVVWPYIAADEQQALTAAVYQSASPASTHTPTLLAAR